MVSAASFRPLADPQRLWGATARSAHHLEANPRRVAADLLRIFIANRTPVTLWGPVGSRKTRTIESFSREVDENGIPYQVITIQPSTQDPTIIHGMMYTADVDGVTVMRRSVPRVAEQVIDYASTRGGLTILFADEMTTCMPSQQNAMLGLLTHGKFEDADISPHIAIVMAANPEGTVSSVIPLNEAVLNRGGHIAWYGDTNLFLEEWRAGFGNPRLQPQPSTASLIEAMFSLSPDTVFRSTNRLWTPDSLVPWDMMEHTERAVTEFARIVETIEDVFSESKSFVVSHYVIEAARAILGPVWASVCASALDQRASSASIPAIMEWTRAALESGLETTESVDEIRSRLGSPWFDGMRYDEAMRALNGLTSGTWRDGRFSYPHYVAGWALIALAPNEADRNALASNARPLVTAAAEAMEAGHLDRAKLVPAFVTRDVRSLAINGATTSEP